MFFVDSVISLLIKILLLTIFTNYTSIYLETEVIWLRLCLHLSKLTILCHLHAFFAKYFLYVDCSTFLSSLYHLLSLLLLQLLLLYINLLLFHLVWSFWDLFIYGAKASFNWLLLLLSWIFVNNCFELIIFFDYNTANLFISIFREKYYSACIVRQEFHHSTEWTINRLKYFTDQ